MNDTDTSNDTIPDPLDNPPTEVIIVESCTAKFNASGFPGGGGGDCDNGLGFTAVKSSVPIYQGYPYPSVVGQYSNGISEGTRYTTKSGGAEIVLTCSPSASCNLSGAQQGGAGCSVNYSSSIIVPQIALAGLTRTSDGYKFLTGQQITGSIAGGGLPVKANSHKWNVTGGEPFKNYDHLASSDQKKPLEAGDLDNPTLSYYTLDKDTVKTTCEVEFEFPAGAKVEGNLPKMTIKAREVASVRPELGTWDIEDGVVGPPNPTTVFGLTGNSLGKGQSWTNVTLTMPASFQGNGSACFAQLITASRHLARQPVGNHDASFINVTYGQEALDIAFPYLYHGSWPVTAIGAGEDSPNQLLGLPTLNDGGGHDWISASASDAFKTWLMFRPDAVGSQNTVWVPIAQYQWDWSGSATKNTNGTWTLSAGIRPPGQKIAVRDTNHPTWNAVSGSSSPPHPILFKAGNP